MTKTASEAVASEVWMDEAACAYGVKAELFGQRVLDEDGKPVMSYEEFTVFVDRFFFGGHDDKPSSGDETRRLLRAVRECLTCPVRKECLRYAVAEDNSLRNGIYGGTTKWERQTVLLSALFSHLSKAERLRILERLVEAKALGWAHLSVPLDHAERALRAFTDEEWEAYVTRSEQLDDELEEVA